MIARERSLEVLMRGYMELIDFMKHLADGILDYLPEDQRVGMLTVDQVISRILQHVPSEMISKAI
jgi:hypothetical protein